MSWLKENLETTKIKTKRNLRKTQSQKLNVIVREY